MTQYKRRKWEDTKRGYRGAESVCSRCRDAMVISEKGMSFTFLWHLIESRFEVPHKVRCRK